MRDVWKSALEWYIYDGDPQRKTKYAVIVMAIKQRLDHLKTRPDLFRHYMETERLAEQVVAEVFPDEEWLDMRQTEDLAYGVRCLEISTGKRFDLLRQTPSPWVIETVA